MLSDILMLIIVWAFVGVVVGYVAATYDSAITTYGDLLISAVCGPLTIIFVLAGLANSVFENHRHWRKLCEFLNTQVR